MGAALSALNPKNLPLALAAGLSLAQLSGGESAIGLTVFTVLAGSSVLVPVLAYLLFRARMQQPLTRLKDWLARDNATVMFIVLLVLGVVTIGKGLAAI